MGRFPTRGLGQSKRRMSVPEQHLLPKGRPQRNHRRCQCVKGDISTWCSHYCNKAEGGIVPSRDLRVDPDQLRVSGAVITDCRDTCGPKFAEATATIASVQGSWNGRTANALLHLHDLWGQSDTTISRRLTQLAESYQSSSDEYTTVETNSRRSFEDVRGGDQSLNL